MSQDHPLSGRAGSRAASHALGEYVIKIKYFVGRFIADVGIIHALYVPRLAVEATIRLSGQFEIGLSLLRFKQVPCSGLGPDRRRVGTNRSSEVLLKTVSRYILILSL